MLNNPNIILTENSYGNNIVVPSEKFREMFIKGRAAARYRVLASIIPVREKFSWNFSFQFSKHFS